MNFVNLVQIILIFISTTISAFLALVALLISKEASFKVAKNIWARSLCIIAGCNIITKGINNLQDLEGPVIFCANHLSNFDIIAIYMAIDRPIYFIAKKELNKIPFLGWYMKVAGMVFIDRTNQTKAINSLKEAGELIKKGRNIITFPEGTRSKNGEISTSLHDTRKGTKLCTAMLINGKKYYFTKAKSASFWQKMSCGHLRTKKKC